MPLDQSSKVDMKICVRKVLSQTLTPGGGGGGGALTPIFGRYVLWQSVKIGGSGASSSMKMRGSRASSSVKVGVSGTDCRKRLAGSLGRPL